MKRLILICIIGLVFNNIFAAEYTVPLAAYSVYAEDLDLDGYMDIVVGHQYCAYTNWGGISVLSNNGTGEFNVADTFFFENGFAYIYGNHIDNNNYIDIFGQYVSNEPIPSNNRYIGIIYNYGVQGFSNINYIQLNTREPVHYLTSGDTDNNNTIDVAVASHNGQFWGVLYNDGNGQFSPPQYHYENYRPLDIACGNLNQDGRNDIAICGLQTDVYFSYDSGYQCFTLTNDFKEEISIADMDNDGDNDIITLVNLYLVGYTGITLFENIGNNSFTPHSEILFQPPLSHFRISDVDNDSLPDVACTGDDGIYVLMNSGNFILSAPNFFPIVNYGEFSRRSFCADLDGNGYEDVITVRYLHAPLPSNLNILFNDGSGNFVEDPVVGIIKNGPPVPTSFDLRQNYPNPFNNTTIISYYLEKVVYIELSIHNINGQLIKTIANEQQKVGMHSVRWDGTNNAGKEVSSGVYLYTLRVGNEVITRKMSLIR